MAINSAPIRVAIVEDTGDIRKGLEALINGSPGFTCVGAFPSAESALQKFQNLDVDVALMDIKLPGMSGIECIRELKAKKPALQIMMLTVLEDTDAIFDSLSAGATGYLIKTTHPAKLLQAIEDLHQGGSPMSNLIARKVVEVFQPRAGSGTEKLSPREEEILNFLSKGFMYKEIASELGISIDTVRTHIRRIYEKLQVRTRTEALKKTGRAFLL